MFAALIGILAAPSVLVGPFTINGGLTNVGGIINDGPGGRTSAPNVMIGNTVNDGATGAAFTPVITMIGNTVNAGGPASDNAAYSPVKQVNTISVDQGPGGYGPSVQLASVTVSRT